MSRRDRDPRSPSPVGSSYSRSSRRDYDSRDSRRDHRYRSHRSRSRSAERRPRRRYSPDRDRERDRDRGERDRDRDRDRDRERERDRDRDRLRDRDRDRDRERERERERDRRRRYDDDSYRSSRRDRGYDQDRSRNDRSLSRDRRHRSNEPDRPHHRATGSTSSAVPTARGHTPAREAGAATPVADEKSEKTAAASTTAPASVVSTASDGKTKADRLAKIRAWKEKQEAERLKKLAEELKKSEEQAQMTAPEPTASHTVPERIEAEKGTVTATAKPDNSLTSKPGPTTATPLVFGGLGNKTGSAPTRALNGFGLGKTSEKPNKRSLAFGDEESGRKKLARLPSPEPNSSAINAPPAGEDVDEDGDATMAQNEANGTVTDEDEVDPLDAFMNQLGQQTSKKEEKTRAAVKSKIEPEALFSEDEAPSETEVVPAEDVLSIGPAKRREIPVVDHSKIDYEPFRKAFYTLPAEHAELSAEEVSELRRCLDGIRVRGLNVPPPVQKWAQCGLGTATLDVVQRLGYANPTSIQAQAIPTIMSGRDVIGVAKTGSGKTIAFLIPMFRHIKDQRPLEPNEGPIGLILTPTRELCTQIYRDFKPFLKALNLSAVCAYGGAPITEQIAKLKKGAEIIVCTPGRMIELLATNAGRVVNLRRVTYVVLDEADRMFDLGFEPQVMRILGNVRPQRQTLLFSATFPRAMEALARRTLTQPVEIIVGGRSVVAPEIEQIVEVRTEDTKLRRLLELLGQLYDTDEDARTLVFVSQQKAADTLLAELLRKGYPCHSIHGGKNQEDRDSNIADFKSGAIPVLIATSVAARGLDVKQLKLVVNYDAPNHLEDYVHRAGRTGRAGNKGTAVTFITPDQGRYAPDIARALKQSGQPVPEDLQALVDGFNEKVKAGKEKASASGFGGKGLERLDQERDAARSRERKAYKSGDGDNDEEEEEDADSGGKGLGVSKSRTSTVAEESSTTATAGPATGGPASSAATPSVFRFDDQIIIHRTEQPTAAQTPTSATTAASSSVSNNPLDRVAAAVASISSRLGKPVSLPSHPANASNGPNSLHHHHPTNPSTPSVITGSITSLPGGTNTIGPGQPIDNKGPDAGAFHARLEINDFPQKARWAVTNRTNVAKILDATATSITTKGNYYPPGKVPGPGEAPKLYILVEGDTEMAVKEAMMDLKRLLKEGTMLAQAQEDRGHTGGKYRVV